jgi:hypothetical protein
MVDSLIVRVTFNEAEPSRSGAKSCESRAMIGDQNGRRHEARHEAECEKAMKSADRARARQGDAEKS